jgi:hypothetical protein
MSLLVHLGELLQSGIVHLARFVTAGGYWPESLGILKGFDMGPRSNFRPHMYSVKFSQIRIFFYKHNLPNPKTVS